MSSKPLNLEQLLSVESRRQLIETPSLLPPDLSLPNAQLLARHLRGLGPPQGELRIGVVHSYTSDLLDPWLELHAAIQGLGLSIYHAPYGLNLLEAQPGSGLVSHEPNLTLLLLQQSDLHPDLALPPCALDGEQRKALARESIDRLCGILGRFRAHVSGRLVVTILPRLLPAGLGLFDAQAEQSEASWWQGFKAGLAGRLREELSATVLLDLDAMLLDLGRDRFFDTRFWYGSRYPFRPAAALELARRVLALAVADRAPKAKVIALDADNTLWGGVIGEDGINGIALGHEYPGNVYLDFQRRLLELQRRGFILVLCSKNNWEDVQEVLTAHPHQILRDRHFAARRVNWLSKSENLKSIAQELNLGLDSFVFVDDSDHECFALRRDLPEVTVVQIPSRPLDIPGCLDRIARLEVLALTAEDLEKTRMYASERQRREHREALGEGDGIDGYLASLNMQMSVAIDDAPRLVRLAQLTQKTNQFNLTTRRYSEEQMRAFIDSPDWVVASFSLKDIFGDSGVVGLGLIRLTDAETAEIDSLLMSCRVIGRRAESAFLEALLGHLARLGVRQVIGDYVPSAKNRLVEAFLPGHGFLRRADGRFERDLERTPPAAQSTYAIAVELDGFSTNPGA